MASLRRSVKKACTWQDVELLHAITVLHPYAVYPKAKIKNPTKKRMTANPIRALNRYWSHTFLSTLSSSARRLSSIRDKQKQTQTPQMTEGEEIFFLKRRRKKKTLVNRDIHMRVQTTYNYRNNRGHKQKRALYRDSRFGTPVTTSFFFCC